MCRGKCSNSSAENTLWWGKNAFIVLQKNAIIVVKKNYYSGAEKNNYSGHYSPFLGSKNEIIVALYGIL